MANGHNEPMDISTNQILRNGQFDKWKLEQVEIYDKWTIGQMGIRTNGDYEL